MFSIVTTNIQKTLESTDSGAEHISSANIRWFTTISPTVHPTLAEPSWSGSSSRETANKCGLRTRPCLTPLAVVKGDEKLVPHFTYKLCFNAHFDRCIWLPAFLSYFFSQSFVDSSAFWCHHTTCSGNKGIEWRLQCQSLLIFFFFMLLIDLWNGLCRIWLWGRMCDLYVKECFRIVPQSSCKNIQTCIVIRNPNQRLKNAGFSLVSAKNFREILPSCSWGPITWAKKA